MKNVFQMGNNASVDRLNDLETDLEHVRICPKSLSNNVLINNFASAKHRAVSNVYSASNHLETNSSNEPKNGRSNEPDSRPIKTDLKVGGTRRTLFYFRKKKRKDKLYKSVELAKSGEQIANEAVEQNLSKHVQVGNGLVSLRNLNYYLKSNSEYHLVNRIIKRIGVFNRQTQTDFESFDDECLKLIEVSQHLVEQLSCLNTDHLIKEEIEEQQHEGFNMIYCGKSNHKQNKRNVCIQRCVSRATQGTQTIESKAHLIIIQILRRLSAVDEQVRLINCAPVRSANGTVKCDLINEKKYEMHATFRDDFGDKLDDKFDNNFHAKSDLHSKNDANFNDNFDGQLSVNLTIDKTSDKLNYSKNSTQLKRKSDTVMLSDELLNDLHRIYRKKFNSQPILGSQTNNGEAFKMNLDDLKENDSSINHRSTDHLDSMDKQKLEEYLKNLLLEVQLSQEHQKKG